MKLGKLRKAGRQQVVQMITSTILAIDAPREQWRSHTHEAPTKQRTGTLTFLALSLSCGPRSSLQVLEVLECKSRSQKPDHLQLRRLVIPPLPTFASRAFRTSTPHSYIPRVISPLDRPHGALRSRSMHRASLQ